jgi:FMN phosphatase YigB (HAD superfamily)
MEEYVANDSRFKLVTYEKNKGLFGARVAGAKAAQGQYIAFLDSDDYVSLDFYRLAMEKAESNAFDVVMGDTVIVNADGSKFVFPVHRECVIEDEYYGEEVRKAFYSQEMNCYAWHTIWNKIYKKTVWDRCKPFFEKVDQHIIMTEDVGFSSLLFYEAESFAYIHTPSVFYCMHATSSTGSSLASVKKTLKNYEDIVTIFEMVNRFLETKHDEACLASFMKARERFCRMWHTAALDACQGDAEATKKVKALSKRLCPECDGENDPGMQWYERNSIIWDPTLENMKERIADKSIKMVSFDIFDTLVLRPFAKPTDIFELMQPEMTELLGATQISFADIRRQSEEIARKRAHGREDIVIDEIYQAMSDYFAIDESICSSLMAKEREYEIRYILPRKTGIELLEYALACQKKVALISDMYLDRATVEQMLAKAGVTGWSALFISSEAQVLKWSGKLFQKALAAMNVDASETLHIGDNHVVDHDAAINIGMQAMIHPKPMDAFRDISRSRLCELGKQVQSAFAEKDEIENSIAGRCMQALIANRIFDNAFQPQHPLTFFSGSYMQMGYAAVGPHLTAIADWLIQLIRENGYTYIAFLARDGYLIMKALEIMMPQDLHEKVKLDYLVASRKILLPALTMQRMDFYALPINFWSYTPEKLWQLLSFCSEGDEHDFFRAIEKVGLTKDRTFTSEKECHDCVSVFLEGYYSSEKHEQALNALRAYYTPLCNEHAACFDMGYSGRLQAAISSVCDRPVPVCFIHRDGKDQCERMSQAYNFKVHSFYDIKPGMSGAMREFLLSADEPGAQSVELRDGKPYLTYCKSEYNRIARFVVQAIQQHALEFVKDWNKTFGNTPQLKVARTIFSQPFESMLRYLKPLDAAMFDNCLFEDAVFAGDDHMDLARLICEQANAANESLYIMRSGVTQLSTDLVTFHPARVSKVKRVLGYLLFDKARLKTAVRNRLVKYPKVFKLAKKVYKIVKK